MNRRYPWILVGLLWVIWLLNYLDRQVIFSLFPLLSKELNLSDVQLGLIGTSFLWVYAAASPLAGYLADRIGRKPIILTSLAVWSAVTWATGHVRTFPELLACRALMGISEACYLPAGLALIAAWHSDKTRSKATGLHYSGVYLGIVMGGALGGWLGQNYGWRTAFGFLGAFGLLYSVIAALGLKERVVERKQPPNILRSAGELFRLPGYPRMFAVFGLSSIANWVVYTWLPLYLYERFHMSLIEAGFSAAFYGQAGSIAGVALGGWAGDRASSRLTVQAAGLAASAPFLFLAGFTSTPALLFVGMFVYGIGRGVYDSNAMPALCDIAPENLRATGYGLFNFIGPATGGVVAAGAGALKASIGIGGALELTAFTALLAAALLYGGRQRSAVLRRPA